MERLTRLKRGPGRGISWYKGEYTIKGDKRPKDCFNRLAEYENTGATPEECAIALQKVGHKLPPTTAKVPMPPVKPPAKEVKNK